MRAVRDAAAFGDRSIALELGLALFQERVDRLAVIGGRVGQGLQAGRQLQQRVEPAVAALDQQALGHAHSVGRVDRDPVGQGLGGIQKSASGTTRETSPQARASWAFSMSPVNAISQALE